ncbi:MAG TPA: hypothetical protein VIJ20_00220, partial [Solirubrobacteraceae bacterium]
MGRREALAGFAGLFAGLLAALGLAASAHADVYVACSDGTCTETFSGGGAGQTWPVPAGVTSATFTVDGAAGGAGDTSVAGGDGGQVSATIGSLTPGEMWTVNVGGAGDGGGPSGDGAGGSGGGGDDKPGGDGEGGG